jgi:hypothetical protein
MRRAGFDKIFVGIESPSEESLKYMGAQKNLQGDKTLLEKVRVLQSYGFEVQAGFILGLDTDPDDIADQMIDFIQEAGIPVAMVGILGVLRDTPDYKRYQRAGRLVETAKYRGDSGIFSRELSFVPKIDPGELFDRLHRIVSTINSPARFYERCLTLFRHRLRMPRSPMRIGSTIFFGFWRTLWRLGVLGSYRREFWRFLGKTMVRHTENFPHAVTLAAQGHHLITTTQDALQVEELTTFLSEALERLEHFCQGSRESLQRGVGARAGQLMRMAEGRFKLFQDDSSTLRYNAQIVLTTAHEYYAATRKECRRQLSEPLAGFQREIERLLEAHGGGAPAPQPA